MKCMLDEEYYAKNKLEFGDPYTNVVPWNESIVNSNIKRRIGYFKTTKILPSCTACQRGLNMALEAL